MNPENQEEELEQPSAPAQQSSSFQSYSPRPRKRGVILRWIAIILVLGLLGFAGFSVFRAQEGSTEEEVVPTPTIEEVPTETPTPEPEGSPTPTSKPTATPTKAPTSTPVPTKGLTLKVLNGSGTAGEAGRAADFLRDLGYAVQSTGNADNFDYESTEIQITAAKENLLASLKKDVEGKYSVGTTSAILSSSEGVDVVIIVGKK